MSLVKLATGRYQLKMTCQQDLGTIRPSLSAWRGAFGHGLKKLVCVVSQVECPKCFLQSSCLYSNTFEPRPDPQKKLMSLYTRIPTPYALFQERAAPEGKSIRLLLTLFGEVNAHLPHLLMAFDRAGHSGVGQGRKRFFLEEASEERSLGREDFGLFYTKKDQLTQRETSRAWPSPPPPPREGDVIIDFLSPIRMRFAEDLVTPSSFTFGIFFRNIMRRLSLLVAFYGQSPLGMDFRGLMECADKVSLGESHLSWEEWTRFSSRQNVSMQMGGVGGGMILRAQDLAPFWEILWWGQWTGVGKGTTMGNGFYRIRGANDQGRENRT